MIKASIFLMPKRCRYINKKVSKMVMHTPTKSGMPNNNCKPIAIPNTSAKSQAAIANSANTYNIKLTGLG